MSQDQIFRNVLIGVLLPLVPIAAYYRLRSQATGEKLDRRQEGWFILSTLRPVGLAIWIGLAVWMIDPSRMVWSSVDLPAATRWAGVGVLALAFALLLWTLHTLGKNLTDTVVTRQKHSLVTNGPYRWIRHPFYDAALLLTVAISLTTANWFFLLAGILFFVLVWIRSRTEEKNLLARFGDSYRRYRETTGAFLPRLKM